MKAVCANDELECRASSYQRQLWVSTGVHAKLKVAGPEPHHGTTLPGQDGWGQQCVGKAGAWRNGDQVRAGSLFPIHGVDESSQLLCV